MNNRLDIRTHQSQKTEGMRSVGQMRPYTSSCVFWQSFCLFFYTVLKKKRNLTAWDLNNPTYNSETILFAKAVFIVQWCSTGKKFFALSRPLSSFYEDCSMFSIKIVFDFSYFCFTLTIMMNIAVSLLMLCVFTCSSQAARLRKWVFTCTNLRNHVKSLPKKETFVKGGRGVWRPCHTF